MLKSLRRRIEQVEKAAQLLEARRLAEQDPRREPEQAAVDVVRDLDGTVWAKVADVCAVLELEADLAGAHCDWADGYIRAFSKRLYATLAAAEPYARV